MNLVLKNGHFPDSLPWGFIENRHIIRVMFNFAALLWLNNDSKNALVIFKRLLKSNPNDNIGARYAIAALLDGVKSLFELEQMFQNSNGFLNWEKQEKWFTKIASKNHIHLGWWLELEE